MFHDKDFMDTAKKELFSLGEGQVGYVREMNAEERADLPANFAPDNAWGVFSAQGEMLAVCDSPQSAWAYFAENSLLPVSLH